MNHKERIFQAVLFEAIAVLISAIFVHVMNTAHEPATGKVLVMLIAISVIAMVWGFVFNLVFDHFFTGDKLKRPIWLRIMHVLAFEGGLMCFTVPLMMWVLEVGLWQALVMDITLTLVILVYGFFYYWLYDYLRAVLVARIKS